MILNVVVLFIMHIVHTLLFTVATQDFYTEKSPYILKKPKLDMILYCHCHGEPNGCDKHTIIISICVSLHVNHPGLFIYLISMLIMTIVSISLHIVQLKNILPILVQTLCLQIPH